MNTSKDDLSEARRQLLARRLQGGAKAQAPAQDSSPPSFQPLSRMQQQIWLLQERYPTQAAYHITNAWRIQGELDLARLENSLNRLVARHVGLRRFCAQERDELVLRYLPACKVSLSAKFVAAASLAQTIRDFGNQTFNLYQGPLFRIGIWRLNAQEHVLVWVIHHLLVDEQSLSILWSELRALYVGSTLPDLPSLEAETRDLEAVGAVGKTQSGPTSGLPLVTDFIPPEDQAFKGRLLTRSLPASRFEEIQGFCQKNRLTKANFWLALFGATLCRYGATKRLAVGVPFSRRKTAAQLQNVGLWLESLPVSLHCDPSQNFMDFCHQVQNDVLASAEQEQIDTASETEIDSRNRESNFRTMVVMESAPEFGLPGLTIEPIPVDMGWSKFDLTFFVNESDAQITIEFDTARFRDDTIAMVLSHVDSLVRRVCGAPDSRLEDLLRASDAERKTLEPSLGRGEKASVTLLPQCFEAVVQRTPDAVAVADAERSLTYQELAQSCRQLAGALQKRGVATGSKVCVYLESDFEFLVAIVGIHMAGGAYVPLDPAYPSRHVQDILQDLSANSQGENPIVVSNDRLWRSLNQDAVFVDVASTGDALESVVIQPQDPAYVIYTSGSTGKPKGVVISHGGLAQSNQSRLDYYGPTDTYLLLSSFAFDSSIAGIFWALASGGTLIVTGRDERADPLHIESLLAKHRVSHTLMLPGLWDVLLKSGKVESFTSLRGVIVAGDVCDPSIVQRHLETLPAVTLFNEYGPTECTVWAAVHPCTAEDQRRPVPIGQPPKHLKLWVLDDNLKVLPPGAVGELYASGHSLTDGYLGLAKKSDSVLMKHQGSLLYRTGDLARLGADGNLHFHGRRDSQIKIRGFRLEPQDLEQKLCAYAEVREAAVTKRDNQLVAFFVPEKLGVDGADLRDQLKVQLPRHLVPNHVVPVDDLPRLSNGKLDRAGLTDLEFARHSAQPALAKQSDAIQVAVSHVWTRLLGVDTIRSTDDFFELGGDSLLGMQMLLELRRQFGVDIKIPALFEASRLYQLAKIVRDASPNATTVAPIRKVGTRPAVFCVHAKTQFLLKALPEEYPIYLVFGDPLHQGRQLKSVQEVAAVYVRDLLAAQPNGPYYLLGFSAGGMIAYEMASQLLTAGKSVELVALADPPPFVNMSHWRFRIYRKLFHMRMAGGLWRQGWYLLKGAPGILQRMVRRRVKRAVNKVILETGKPMSLAQIEFGILQRYVELGKTYQYPSLAARCEIFVTDSHPMIVEDMRRQWQSLNGEKTTLRVISGAENHLDLMKKTHGMDLAQQFVDALLLTSGKKT